MRTSLCALLTVSAALCLVAPASAADKDAFNSSGLRKAVTLERVREHQAALQSIANMNGGRRVSGTAGFDASADYVVDKLEAAGYDVTRQEFTFDYFEELAPADVRAGLADADDVHDARAVLHDDVLRQRRRHRSGAAHHADGRARRRAARAATSPASPPATSR